MARDPQAALVALNRFGFGARGGASGDFVNAASDPRGFVKAELQPPQRRAAGRARSAVDAGAGPGDVRLSGRGQAGPRGGGEIRRADAGESAAAGANAPRRNLSLDASRWRWRRRNRRAQAAADNGAANAAWRRPKRCSPMPPSRRRSRSTSFRRPFAPRRWRGSSARTIAECGFVERLVAFWSNHFCISATKGEPARIWAGSFEREAIRPHVLGRFADMLKAVEQHPAMLFFLDNQQSLGPDSRAGQNRKRGLNENLAREIMELHTLGVGGGYTQDDVTSLARIITGWTFAGPQGKLGAPGSFVFNANAHQPGPQLLLGKTYDDNGVAQGEAALADIARHPSTAKFIATKFARHFVADDPPPALVARLQDVFRKTDGDLKALAAALVDSDEAWQAPLTKMRTPLRIPGRDRPAAGADSGGSRPLSRRPQSAGPAVVVAGRAERISRHQRGVGRARRHEAAARHRRADRLAPRRQHRSARSARSRRRPTRRRRRRGGPSSARNRGSRRWRCC